MELPTRLTEESAEMWRERQREREREEGKREAKGGVGGSLLETGEKNPQTLKQIHYVNCTLLMAAFLHLYTFRSQLLLFSFSLRINLISII